MTGLKMIPEIDSIFIYEKGEVDAWGLGTVSNSKREVKGRIKGAESSTPIESKGGKQIVPTYSISINGDAGITVGDVVEIYNNEMVVLTRQPKKDLSGKILYTKYTV